MAPPRDFKLWCGQKQALKHLLSNLCLVSRREKLQVGQQRAGLDHPLVVPPVQLPPKEDVLHQSCVLDPGLLRDKSHGALPRGDPFPLNFPSRQPPRKPLQENSACLPLPQNSLRLKDITDGPLGNETLFYLPTQGKKPLQSGQEGPEVLLVGHTSEMPLPLPDPQISPPSSSARLSHAP